MGAKNLKAVVVIADQKTQLADETGFKAITKKFCKGELSEHFSHNEGIGSNVKLLNYTNLGNLT